MLYRAQEQSRSVMSYFGECQKAGVWPSPDGGRCESVHRNRSAGGGRYHRPTGVHSGEPAGSIAGRKWTSTASSRVVGQGNWVHGFVMVPALNHWFDAFTTVTHDNERGESISYRRYVQTGCKMVELPPDLRITDQTGSMSTVGNNPTWVSQGIGNVDEAIVKRRDADATANRWLAGGAAAAGLAVGLIPVASGLSYSRYRAWRRRRGR
jgi:hypothetical protein